MLSGYIDCRMMKTMRTITAKIGIITASCTHFPPSSRPLRTNCFCLYNI